MRHMSVNDLPVGRSVDETLRLVKAFQFVAEHGEVCPAGWNPDSPTVSRCAARGCVSTLAENPSMEMFKDHNSFLKCIHLLAA